MGFTKHGTGDVLREGDSRKTASLQTAEDKIALDAENAAADTGKDGRQGVPEPGER